MLFGIIKYINAYKFGNIFNLYMQRIGIIGSGDVGQSLALGFLKLGFEVRIGTREPDKLAKWLDNAGAKASVSSFKDAARFGDILILCTKWIGTENAIKLSDKDNFKGKIVIDVTNPLVFLKDIPELDIAYPNSGGLKIQRMLPDSKVVKAFNTVTAKYMCNPKLEEGVPDLFIGGNDEESKEIVKGFAEQFGWNVTDIGNIEQSYLLEALAMLWIRYGFLNNHWMHAFKLLKK